MPKHWWPYIALLVVNLLYGANYTIARSVMPDPVTPLAFILMRVIAATFLFHLTLVFFKWKLPKKEDVPRLVLCGLLGVATNQMLFFEGLSRTSRITASLIMITVPILVLIFSAIVWKEHLSLPKIAGVLLGAVGAGMIITGKKANPGGSDLTGNILVFLNATSFAAYLVTVKGLMKKYDPLTVITWVFTFGSVFVIPFGCQQLIAIDFSSFNTETWLAVLYVLVLNTYAAYGLNIYALQHVNASVVGVFIYLQPIFASVVAIIWADEALSLPLVLAAFIIFIGVYLVNRPQKPAAAGRS